jgi:hypothetical protein
VILNGVRLYPTFCPAFAPTGGAMHHAGSGQAESAGGFAEGLALETKGHHCSKNKNYKIINHP